MKECSEKRREQRCRLVAVALFLVINIVSLTVSASAYASLLEQPSLSVTSPSVVLQLGTAGNSTIYTNYTSSKTSVGSTGAWSDELLVNSGFEMGNLTGWTAKGPAAASVEVFSATSGGDTFTNKTLRIGNYGVCTKDTPGTDDDSGLWQNVSLIAYASEIDAGNVVINASAWLYPSEWAWDDLALIVRFYNSSGGFISAWNTTGEYGSGTAYYPRAWMLGQSYSHFIQGQLKQFGCQDYPVPAGTRTVAIQLGMGEHAVPGSYCGGQADEASVRIRRIAQTLYAHQELTLVGGFVCRLLKLNSADSAGTTFGSDAGTSGRRAWGWWVYQLAGISSIPASTWSIYYRAYKTHASVEAHCDVDILIRMANGTIRQTIATDVGNSGALATAWSTLSGTYSWADFTVVDTTDYLEIDFCVDVTTKRNNEYVYLRADDNTLALVDQTRAANIYLPRTYDFVLGINNTAVDPWQIRLKKYSDSSIARLKNCTIYFRNSTGGNTGQIVIQNGVFTTPTGPWCGLGSSMSTYTAITVQTNSSGTSYLNTYLEVLIPGTTTYAQYIVTFEIT